MYELVYWRYGAKFTDEFESMASAIDTWVAGFDYGECFSPGFVNRHKKIAYLPNFGSSDKGVKEGLALLEEGLGNSLADFQTESFEIPPP